MGKAYLLVICLLVTPFTGCIENDSDDESDDSKVDNKKTVDLRKNAVKVGKLHEVFWLDGSERYFHDGYQKIRNVLLGNTAECGKHIWSSF